MALLTLRSSDIDNIYFILNAKSLHNSSVIFARMNDAYLLPQYHASGVKEVIEPHSAIDEKALRYINNSIGEKSKIIVFGYTRKSEKLCLKLHNEKKNLIIYDNDEVKREKAIKLGFKDIYTIDYEQVQYIEEIQLQEHDFIICAMDDEALNVYHSISLRSNGFKGKIVALSDSKEDNRKLHLAGVSKIYDMYEESAILFVEMLKDYVKERNIK